MDKRLIEVLEERLDKIIEGLQHDKVQIQEVTDNEKNGEIEKSKIQIEFENDLERLATALLERFETELSERQEDKERIQTLKQELQEQIETSQTEIEEANSAIESLNKDKQALEQEIELLQGTYEERDGKLVKTRIQEQYETELSKVMAELEKRQNIISSSESKVSEKESEIQELLDKYQVKESDITVEHENQEEQVNYGVERQKQEDDMWAEYDAEKKKQEAEQRQARLEDELKAQEEIDRAERQEQEDDMWAEHDAEKEIKEYEKEQEKLETERKAQKEGNRAEREGQENEMWAKYNAEKERIEVEQQQAKLEDERRAQEELDKAERQEQEDEMWAEYNAEKEIKEYDERLEAERKAQEMRAYKEAAELKARQQAEKAKARLQQINDGNNSKSNNEGTKGQTNNSISSNSRKQEHIEPKENKNNVTKVEFYIKNNIPAYRVFLKTESGETKINETIGYEHIKALSKEDKKQLKKLGIGRSMRKYCDAGLLEILTQVDKTYGTDGVKQYLEALKDPFEEQENPIYINYDFSKLYKLPNIKNELLESSEDRDLLDSIRLSKNNDRTRIKALEKIAKNGAKIGLVDYQRRPRFFDKLWSKITSLKLADKSYHGRYEKASNRSKTLEEAEIIEKEKWQNEMYQSYINERNSKGFSRRTFEEQVHAMNGISKEDKDELLSRIAKAEESAEKHNKFRDGLKVTESSNNRKPKQKRVGKYEASKKKEDSEIQI